MTAPTALVSGANRGIGLEVVRQLTVDHGWRVWLGSRDAARGLAAADQLPTAADVRVVQLDVANESSVRTAVSTLDDGDGQLDVLINNAAVDYDTDQRAVTADLQRVRDDLEVNLFGAWQLTQAGHPSERRTDRRVLPRRAKD